MNRIRPRVSKSTAIWFLSAAAACFILFSHSAFAQSWPDLAKPAPAAGGGGQDAAVIVAVENYAFVSPIPGAKANANAWYDYFVKTRGVPRRNVFLRVDSDVAAEDMRKLAASAAASAGEGGTLWFVFIGHGAPSPDGMDGLLVGVDAQQKVESLNARSLARGELLSVLAKSKAGTIAVLMDACFSGRNTDGTQLVRGLQPLVAAHALTEVPGDPRFVVLTAAKGNEFAGQLPGSPRPAFSYLALGGLRGWADDDGDGLVTAAELHSYSDGVLRTMAKDRTQTPMLMGEGAKLLARSAGEQGPDLAELAKKAAVDTAPLQFKVSALPEVPAANAPAILAPPSASEPSALARRDAGIDFGSVDVDALEKYDDAVGFEKGAASPEDKAEKWRHLGNDVPAYAEIAGKREEAWKRYAEEAVIAEAAEFAKGPAGPQEKAAKWRDAADKAPSRKETSLKMAREWERYAEELAAAQEARGKRAKLRDADYAKLKRLLALSVAGASDKQSWAEMFVKAYGSDCDDNPWIADIVPFLSSATQSGLSNVVCAAPPPRLPDGGAKAAKREPSARETAIHGGAVNLDLNYPGAGLRFFLSGKTAVEGRLQYDGDNLVGGARLYRYPALLPAGSRFSPYLGVEGDYVSFKGSSSKGTGMSAGAFAGIEYSLARSVSMQLDAGGAYLALKDKDTNLTQSGMEFVLNVGVNFYLK